MNKVFKVFYIAFLLFVVMQGVKVYATQAAPSPICHVEGVIKSVEFKDAYDDACVAFNLCPTDIESSHPARYFLGVKVSDFSYVSGEQPFSKCSDYFTIGDDTTLTINKMTVKSGDVFKVGQKISGNARFTSGLFLSSYTLINAENTNTKATTTKATTTKVITDTTTKPKGGFWGFISRLFSFLF